MELRTWSDKREYHEGFGEIEYVRADVYAAFMEEVRGVLEGFCPPQLATLEEALWGDIDDSAPGSMTVTCGQMRRARALLAKMGQRNG